MAESQFSNGHWQPIEAVAINVENISSGSLKEATFEVNVNIGIQKTFKLPSVAVSLILAQLLDVFE